MKKDKSLNDEQNLAVYSRGSSILVSAPAGSGKTKILVNRMMSLIEDDHVSVDSLLVLTFTKAAALEMKQRLVESLNKRIHVVDDSLKVHLEKQKILLNDAYITNFHSFCSDLLSQYGYTIHLDSKFEILENPTLIKENILNQCLEKWVQEKEFYDFYQENYTGYQFNSFKEILFQLDNLSHTVYHFDDYLDQVKIKLYDRVINDQTIEDTPFEKPLKKLLHEAFQEAYDSYLKLEDYCQTYGLGFYFEETKKLPAPHTVLENYFQNLKECINQGKYFSMGIEIEKHRAASYKDVDDSIKETYKSLLDQTKNTFSKAYQKCMPSSIEELSEVLKVSYRHLEIYLKYLKEFQKKYQAYKKSLSYLDFNDLEQYTLQLLSENQGVAQTLYQQFHEIMIDEYQDTSSYVLDIFYDAVKNRENVQIYLFGDRMQQIYRNYDGSFEGKLKEFDTSDRLEVNFRSIGKIVSILNNIYNDSSFEQQPTESNANVVPDIEPHVIISSNVPESIYKLQNKFPKILVLYLMNKEKYEEIGAKNLYDAYRGMEAYTFGRKYSPTDILSDMSNDNPDILMKFLFLLNNVIGLYIDKNYGMVISICKKENKYFDSSQFKIKKHADKKSIKNKFDKIIEIYEKDGCLIREVIESLFDNGFIPEKVKNDFEENIEYQKVLDIEMKEVSNLANYLSMPHISTQHGVKGESHTSVIFVASDNGNTPNVRMYPFFELWSELEFSLPQFEELFYSYKKIIEEVEKELGMKVSKLTAETHNKNEKNKTILSKYSKQVLEKYQGNLLFEALCKEDFIAYLKKPNVKNVQKIFKITEIEGILTAYKLFYVGCSRARKNLIIIVEKNKIMNFKEKFVDKAKKIGFTVLS